MNRKTQYKKISLIILGMLLLLGSSSIGALDGAQLEELVSAVVLIQPAMQADDGSYQPVGLSGSGTIIDKENGLILTNYHVSVLTQDIPQIGLRSGYIFEKYLISITTAPDQSPKPTFFAEFRDGDKEKDLAVLKITETTSGKKPNLDDISVFEWKNEKTWRSVKEVHLNDDLIILGYPPYAVVAPHQLTITITRGNVSGFFNDSETISFPRAWVKTDAEISFGNSGGTAIDKEGRFFGIPTAFMEDPSQKTSLGLLRPVDLADVHVEAVKSNPDKRPARPQAGGTGGQRPEQPGPSRPAPGDSGPSDGGILETPSMSIGQILISTRRPEQGMPSESMEQYRYGDVREIYAYFTYRGFKKGMTFNFKWYLNNQLIVDNTFPWEQNTEGAYALPLLRDDGAAFPTGTYGLRITVNGRELGKGSFEITESGSGGGQMIGLAGKVKSADTGKPIPGAAVAFLKPGVTVKDFMAKQSEEQIAAGGMTDREGAYRINIPAIAGKTYAVVVVADTYQPLLADNGITIQDVSRKTYYLNDILLYRY